MKISRDYPESSSPNISVSSLQSIEAFQKKRIQTNIILHKCFLFITVLINIALFLFIFFFKRKLSQLKSLSDKYSSKINDDDDSLSSHRSSIEHRIVNIGSQSHRGGFLFSYLFKNENEINKIKNTIKKFNDESNKKKKKELVDFYPGLIYQSFSHGGEYKALVDEIIYQNNLVFMVETQDNQRFGIFIGDYLNNIESDEEKNKDDIDEDDYGKDEKSKIKDVFIFSMNDEGDEDCYKIFKYIGKSDIAVKFGKKEMINVGENDLIIFNEFFDKGGKMQFPFKNFDCSIIEKNPFTTKNGAFDIKNIEVFKFFE